MNKSIEWVIWLKLFGILAVILGHMNNPFNDFIFSWHMPLFFMISGFFIKTETGLKYLIVKDFKRLMIPYFIFSALAITITTIKLWGLNRDPLNYLDEIISIVFWMDYNHLVNSYAFVLWFLPALFIAKFFYYIIKKSSSNIILQFFLCTLLFFCSFEFQLPFALSNAMNSVLWLMIGSQLFDLMKQESHRLFDSIGLAVSLIIPSVFIVAIYTYWGIPNLNMSMLTYENQFVNLLWAISIFIVLIHFMQAIASKVKSSWLIKQWGEGTMLLFILHPYTNNIAHIIVEKLHFGGWPIKLSISLILLQLLLMLKQHFGKQWIFKYV